MANSITYQDQTFNVGDRLKVHLKIEEEGKTRVQIFEGLLIAVKNRLENCSITVRKIAVGNIGVERIIPLSSPSIAKIELKSSGRVRRSKLYYLRTRTGRQALRVKEKKQIKTPMAKTTVKKTVKTV